MHVLKKKKGNFGHAVFKRFAIPVIGIYEIDNIVTVIFIQAGLLTLLGLRQHDTQCSYSTQQPSALHVSHT